MKTCFAEFAFDPEARELRRAGTAVRLSPKALALLGALLAERPRALSKEELLERLWPGTFVSEGSLTALVSELRRALGSGREGPVRTVHGFGYAFAAEARAEAGAAPSRFRVRWEGREVALAEGENVLGREPGLAVTIPDATVSRRHARIWVHEAEATLEDLGSKNGTFVGARRVDGAVAIADGAALKLGSVLLAFRDVAASGSTRSIRTA